MQIEVDDEREAPALRRILEREMEAVRKRRNVPTGQTAGEVYDELRVSETVLRQLPTPASDSLGDID